MKKMTGFVSLLLALVMLLTACGGNSNNEATEKSTEKNTENTTEATVPSSENGETLETEESTETADEEEKPVAIDTTYVSLQQIGSFEDNGSMVVRSTPLLYEYRSEDGVGEYLLYSDMGEDMLGKWYRDYEYFGDGVTAVYEAGSEYLLCGLVNVNTGDVLLDCGAAMVEQLSDRYYYVIYTTEKTEDRDECFVYLTSAMVSFSPDDDDVMYKGYGTVFDAQEKKLLENIKITEPGTDVYACGDSVCVKTDYYDYDVYDEDGEMIGSVADAQIGDGFILAQTGRVVTVYDPSLQEMGTLDGGKVITGGGDRYISFEDQDYLEGVMDLEGNVLLEAQFQYIREMHGDLIIASKDDKYGITKMDGTEICEYKYSSIYSRLDGVVYELTDENDQEYILFVGKEPIPVAELESVSLAYYSEPDETDSSLRKYVLYSDASTIELHDAVTVGNGLLVYSDEGLVELIGGEVLLDNKYEEISLTNGYLYALKNNTWEIYDVEFRYGI